MTSSWVKRVSVLSLLLLPACGGPSPAEPGVEAESGLVDVHQVLAQARDNGASAAQIALLEEAAAQGEVTLEIARQARRNLQDCAATAGVDIQFHEVTRPDGWVEWVTEFPDVEGRDVQQVVKDCEDRESGLIVSVYSSQPSAVTAKEDYLNDQKPVLIACLEQQGLTPDPALDGMTIARSVMEVDDQSMREGGLQCLLELGLHGI